MLAGVFALGLGEELWSRFIPKYLEFLGAGIWVIGIFGVVKDLLDALYQYPGGWLSDRLGHRKSLILFTLLALGGYLLFMISQGWEFILLGMIFVSAWGSSATPVIFTIIGDNLPATDRSIGFGVQSILKRLPGFIAPVLGGWAIVQFGLAVGMRASFAVSIILALLVVWIILRYYTDLAPARIDRVSAREIWGRMDRRLKRLLIADCFARWAEGIPEVFIILYIVDRLGYNSLQFGTFTSVQMLASLAFYIPIAKLSDRVDRKPFILLTFIFFALFPLSILAGGGYASIVPAFVIGGLREIGEPARKALIVDLATGSIRGRMVGLYYLVRGLIVFPASLIGAWLWTIDPRLPFALAFIAGACGVVTFAASMSSLSPSQSHHQEDVQ
jgi:MFS family permease